MGKLSKQESNTNDISMRVVKCDDITPNEVSQKIKEGHMIVSTPHVGNFTTYGFAIKKLGVLPVFFDGNMPSKDVIAYPAHIIKDNKMYKVAQNQDNITTPYLLSTKSDLPIDKDNIKVCAKTGHMHYVALLNVLDQMSITSEYFYVKNPYAYDILSILLKNNFSCFNRTLTSDGMVIKKDNIPIDEQINNLNNFFDTKKKHMRSIMCGLDTETSECHIPSNEVNVFLMCMRALIHDITNGVIDFTNPQIYTMSGISMINYVQEKYMKEAFDKMYKILYDSKHFNIPQYLIVNMIPGAYLKNMPKSDEYDKITLMDDIANNYKDYKTNKDKLDCGSHDRSVLIKSQSELKKLSIWMRNIWKTFINKSPNRTTQYDDNCDVVIPKGVKDLSFENINKFFNSN